MIKGLITVTVSVQWDDIDSVDKAIALLNEQKRKLSGSKGTPSVTDLSQGAVFGTKQAKETLKTVKEVVKNDVDVDLDLFDTKETAAKSAPKSKASIDSESLFDDLDTLPPGKMESNQKPTGTIDDFDLDTKPADATPKTTQTGSTGSTGNLSREQERIFIAVSHNNRQAILADLVAVIKIGNLGWGDVMKPAFVQKYGGLIETVLIKHGL